MTLLFKSKRTVTLSLLGALALWLAPSPAEAAKPIRIKHGTLAPKGSPWYVAMERMAQRWKEVSNGRVRFKIYAGGVAGDEGDMLRKIRIGQLHAANLTSIGMARITKASMAWQMPMMIHSYAELDALREEMGPRMEEELGKAGFVVLHWGEAGWVNFFSKTDDFRPEALQKARMYMWSGDPDSDAIVKAAGFRTVPLSNTEVMSALQTGMVDWYMTTPLYALSSQWFGLSKAMYALPWTPLNGATVISKKLWDSIEPELREKMMAIAREEGKRVSAEVRALDEKAVEAMKKRGLKIIQPTAKEIAAWQAIAEKAYPALRGKVVPADLFDESQRLSKAYRKSHAK